MRLLPREEKFYAYFLRQVAFLNEAAQLLLDGIKSGNSTLARTAERITEIEHQADEVIHEAVTKLASTFITPLDPEDIHALASTLDDITDGIEEAAHRIAAYKLDPIPPVVIQVCEIIAQQSSALRKAFEALAVDRPFLDHCIEVNRLEGQADRLVRKAMTELFDNEKDCIRLIKVKEVYEILEKTTDYCEDVTDLLQEVIVKNG
jgi:hypothetical protein